MDIKNYGIIYLLVFFVAILFIATRLFPNLKLSNLVQTRTQTPQVQTIVVIVDFGTERKTYASITAPNAYMALVEAVKQDGLEVTTGQLDGGISVEKVGTFANDRAKHWVYEVNGKRETITPDARVLLVGDSVVWLFE
ncbi:MAG: hypothetical protein AAB874_00820 [Patescibacteria group bacterium]